MEHVVFYPAASGVPAFRRVSSLEEAVAFVEHMRNAENVTDFSVHELRPVQLSFRAYYHAEVPADAVVATATVVAEAVVDTAPAPVAAPEPESVVETPEPAFVAEPVAEAAPLSVVPDVPADEPAEADDRSQQWIAEATVVEPAAPDAPPAEADEALAPAPQDVPSLADDPVVAVVPAFADPVDDEAAEAPTQRTPFADAPPVTPAAESETPAEDDAVSASGDVIPSLAPTGRRSLGFFAR
ncbi:MAG TPA: hypothetical protein VME70_14315 [Mycobacteriales bacterium]|nr:hypothetical protein [Mycobacteriales bacterium]